MELSLGEFVKFLLFLMQKNGTPFSLRNYSSWHLLLYRLKNTAEADGKPAFFENLQFDWDGPYPKCQELISVLNALFITGCIFSLSPLFQEYRLTYDVAEIFQKKYELLPDDAKRFLNWSLETVSRGFPKIGFSPPKNTYRI